MYVQILPTTVDPIVVGQGVNGALARAALVLILYKIVLFILQHPLLGCLRALQCHRTSYVTLAIIWAAFLFIVRFGCVAFDLFLL